MQQLSTVLANTQPISKPAMYPLHMQAHGSTNPDGKLTTIPSQQSMPSQNHQLSQQQQKQSESLRNDVPLSDDPEGQNKLTALLASAYASQKTYGDKADMMRYRDQMFQMILGDFPYEVVKKAFIEFLRESPHLPTPSDIYKRIVPPAPKPDWAVYVGLREEIKQGKFVTEREVRSDRS